MAPTTTSGPHGAPVDDQVEVRLMGVPVELHQRTFARIDELRRELALIDADPDAGDVPARVVGLAAEFLGLLGPQLAGDGSALRAAAAAGHDRVDLTYRVPTAVTAAVRDVLVRIPGLLDEVDRLSRARDGLLTLAAPEDEVRYRSWVFGDPVRQLDGSPPTPWT
jgi:hypothetical protein